MEQAKAEIRTSCEIMKNSIDLTTDNHGYLDEVKKAAKSFRITLIDPNGQVTFDSESALSDMESHFNRPEVTAAFATGSGEDLRKSVTLGGNTYYYAFLLIDGYVLRAARNVESVTAVFINTIPIIGGITLLLIIIAFMISSYLTKRLIKPIEQMTSRLDDSSLPVDNIIGYDELTPFFNKLTSQRLKIKQHIASLSQQRDTINAITSNMQEGLIIINEEKKILSANTSAVRLLNGSDAFSYTQKPVISLIHDEKTLNSIETVLKKGESVDTILSRDEKQRRIFINPVHEQTVIKGAIVIILDITDVYKAEQIRREFSANVSHELKTPLTSILGFAEMIQEGLVTDKNDTVKFAANIQKEASRLITLIQDIIRLTEIEENTLQEIEDVDLLEVSLDAISTLEFAAEKNHIKLSVTGQEMVVNANKQMMNELLFNLIDNGIKYNKPNGEVTVTVKPEKGKKVLVVTDTGIGIGKEHLERIFERFYRVDKGRSKQSGGTGLGLSIVKHIASYHNATVEVASKINKGTTIKVLFPE